MADMCGIDKDLVASKKLEDKATKHLADAKPSNSAQFMKEALYNLEGYRTEATKEAAKGHCEEARSLVAFADGMASTAFTLPKKSIMERTRDFVRNMVR